MEILKNLFPKKGSLAAEQDTVELHRNESVILVNLLKFRRRSSNLEERVPFLLFLCYNMHTTEKRGAQERERVGAGRTSALKTLCF